MIRFLALGFVLFVGFSSVAGKNDSPESLQWPRTIEKDGATVIIYQPQIESLSAVNLQSRAAVSVTTKENPAPVFGAMWFDCTISTDRQERIVRLTGLQVSDARFPEAEEADVKALSTFLESEIPAWDLELSLDQLLADLELSDTELELSTQLNNAPPDIIFTTSPAVLILIDGDPIFREIEGSDYERVINTPFLVVKDTRKGDYYIHGEDLWYTSTDFARWEMTGKVPRKLQKIAEEAMGDEEDAPEAGDSGEEAGSTGEVEPDIILRTQPAELLQSNGEPEFAPIEGTSLLYMINTADDILLDIESQTYYIRISGRWYRSGDLQDGEWDYVPPGEVPEHFAGIPADSDMGSVRVSIPGTPEAREAVLDNQIPQTAEVDRNAATLEVTYDGKPKFEPIGGTGMSYAVNTDKSVLVIDERYYCCEDAVWFEADSPNGPWTVSVAVPETVQEIPPESPVYNVKYVHIYNVTPSTVYVGYTPGYVHSYVYRGCVYYGTGYHYRPWYGVRYYPRPVTYGYSVHWNPFTGWGFSFGVSYGWMTYGWGAPRYGWWGPAGYRYGYHYGYRHAYARGYRAGYYAARRPVYGRPVHYPASSNIYRNRPSGVVRTGNTYYDPKTGNRVSRPERPTPRPTDRPNNVYTDPNGNVYRRDRDSWDRVGSGPSTRPSTGDSRPATRPSTGTQRPETTRPSTGTPRPETTRPSTGTPRPETTRPSTGTTRPSARPSQPSQQLNRDYQQRNRGAQRSQQYQQSRPAPSRSNVSPSRQAPSRSAPSRPAPSRSGSGSRRR